MNIITVTAVPANLSGPTPKEVKAYSLRRVAIINRDGHHLVVTRNIKDGDHAWDWLRGRGLTIGPIAADARAEVLFTVASPRGRYPIRSE